MFLSKNYCLSRETRLEDSQQPLPPMPVQAVPSVGFDGVKDVSKPPRLISTTCDWAFTGRNFLCCLPAFLQCRDGTCTSPVEYFSDCLLSWDIFAVVRGKTSRFFTGVENGLGLREMNASGMGGNGIAGDDVRSLFSPVESEGNSLRPLRPWREAVPLAPPFFSHSWLTSGGFLEIDRQSNQLTKGQLKT